jgi:5-hydroxyisourate hydrolase-like protein (transthyretin family)
VLTLAALSPACSSGRKPVNPVRGQILVNGKPAAQAQVLLHPVEGGQSEPHPTGQTDDQGNFTLTSYANGDGAPEGSYAVTVTWFRVAAGGRNEVVRYNALPQRYAVPESSQLRVTIAKGNNELTPLQLYSR